MFAVIIVCRYLFVKEVATHDLPRGTRLGQLRALRVLRVLR